MGDMSDFALDGAFEELEHYERYKNSDLGTQYDEGLIDERGATYGNPSSYPARREAKPKSSGKGECPNCGSSTTKKTGQYGEFYGCNNFPTCKGSRKI